MIKRATRARRAASGAWPRAPSCPRPYFLPPAGSRRSRRRAYHFRPRGLVGPCSRDASARTRPSPSSRPLVPLVVPSAILTQLVQSWSACHRSHQINSWPCATRRRVDRPRSPARPTRAADLGASGASTSCRPSFLVVKHTWRRRRPASGGRGPACWRVSVSRRWRRVWCLGVDRRHRRDPTDKKRTPHATEYDALPNNWTGMFPDPRSRKSLSASNFRSFDTEIQRCLRTPRAHCCATMPASSRPLPMPAPSPIKKPLRLPSSKFLPKHMFA